MAKIEYTVMEAQSLDLIGDLWRKTKEHHRARSQHFTDYFDRMTFDLRKKELLEKSSKGVIHIDLARDINTGELIGYCVSTVSEDKQGEIDSIYIEPDYRQSGIGDNLMKRALGWMDEHSVTKKVLEVGAGNEDLFTFYHRYNFYPRITILEQVKAEKAGTSE